MPCASLRSSADVDGLVRSLNGTSPPVASQFSALRVLNPALTCAKDGSSVRTSSSEPCNHLYVLE